MASQETIYAITSWSANTGRDDVPSNEISTALREWQRNSPANVHMVIVPNAELSVFHVDSFPAGIGMSDGTVRWNGVLSSQGAEHMLSALCPTGPSSTRAPIGSNESQFLCAVLCITLILSSCLTGKIEAPIKSRPPPLGTLVEVGGYRVHLYCVGQGSPTVMIVGAAFSLSTALVQPEVAKFTRVCTFGYPSGTAWSDPIKTAAAPDCDQQVDGMHRLIMKVPIDGPYFSSDTRWERSGHGSTQPDIPTTLLAW